MSDGGLTPKPLLDGYGVWPSHRKVEADGRVWSQDPPEGVRLSIEPARKSAVFLHKECPWEKEARLGVNTVIYEDGRYRLWYGVSKIAHVGETYVCYAESEDGFAWERPDLGRVEYEGSRRNNILCEGSTHYLGAIFRDPSAPPEERYKAIAPKGTYYRDGVLDPAMDAKKFKELLIAMDLGGVSPEERARSLQIRQAVHASVSPDGIDWTNLDDPILDVGNTALDTHNMCTFDPYVGKYVAYLRGHIERRRLVRRAEGTDFRHLEAPRPCLMCDPQDSLDDDVYTPCYCPYPGKPLYLMFPSIYHRIRSTVDIQLAVSRDSYTWSRPERKPIIDLACNGGEYGAIYASPNLIALEDGEWRLPFIGYGHKHDFRDRGSTYPEDGEARWASWKADRLIGLEAPGHGRVTLVQRGCLGREMRLNLRTELDGWIRVELVHPPGTPPKEVTAFEGFSVEEAESLTGDELSRVVRWNGDANLSSLKGKEVSIRLQMYKAKVFSTAL